MRALLAIPVIIAAALSMVVFAVVDTVTLAVAR